MGPRGALLVVRVLVAGLVLPRLALACPMCAAGAQHETRVLWLVGALLVLPFAVGAMVFWNARRLLRGENERDVPR